MSFLDSGDKVISNWGNTHGVSFAIAENEEIIGVYGHKNNGKVFKNFGFIVKVKPTNEWRKIEFTYSKH